MVRQKPPSGLDGAGHMSDKHKVQVGLAISLSEVPQQAPCCFINPQTLKGEHCSSFPCEAGPRGNNPEMCAATARAIIAQPYAPTIRCHTGLPDISLEVGAPGICSHAEFLMFFSQP